MSRRSAGYSCRYGHSPHPMRETDPCAPIFDYAKWKLEAETCVLEAGYTVVRPAALYGHSPRMRSRSTSRASRSRACFGSRE